MLRGRFWIGLWFGLFSAVAAAQDGEPKPAATKLVPSETDATRAAAETCRDELDGVKEMRASAQPAEIRAALRNELAVLLAVPGREASEQIADSLAALGAVAGELHDTECQVGALEPVLAFRIATLDPDDEALALLRTTLGHACWELARLETSKELLGQVLERARRKYEPGDRRLCGAMSDYAVTLYYLNDCENARVLMSEVVELLTKDHDIDDPAIQWALGNLGNMLDKLGDVDGALALRERVHRNYSKSRPEGDADVLLARHNLALSLSKAGDPIAARALLQDVIAWYEKRYPPDHVKLERARQNLSITLHDLGDFESARILLEGIIERRGGKGYDDDPTLVNAQFNLVRVLASQGRREEAAESSRKLLERHTAQLGADNLGTLDAATALAVELSALGEHEQAKALKERVLRTLEEKYPENEYALMCAQGRLGHELMSLDDTAGAAKLFESALESARRRLGLNHELTLQLEGMLSGAIVKSEPERAHQLLHEVGLRLLPNLASASAALSPREAELKAYSLAPLLDFVLSSSRDGDDEALVFELVETARLASWAGTRNAALLDRTCASEASVRKLRDALRSKAALVSTYAQQGRREDYQRAAAERGELEQRLADVVQGFASASLGTMKPARVAARLPEGTAAIAFRRYQRHGTQATVDPVARYLALVLRKDGTLRRVDLAEADKIDRALDCWREALGIDATALDADAQRAAGVELRELLVDRLRDAAGDARTWIVVNDDVLNLIPLDALPTEKGVVGDEIRIEVRTHLGELAAPSPSERRDLVVLGGIDFDALPAAEELAAAAEKKTTETSAMAQHSGERMPPRAAHFAPLSASKAEIAGVAASFRAHATEGPKVWTLEGPRATKSALIDCAGKARWLHVATHGYFAPESFASLDDAARSADFEREVRGLSPRVLCGLALAGANAPEDVLDRTRGVLTAEELAYLDLDGCELAVLSACDSGLGVRRSGQSVASLQSALHAAGARSAITALWTVSDEATRSLMLAFYKGLWEEHLSKAEALWRAKLELRRNRAPTREWAAWVLTGDAR